MGDKTAGAVGGLRAALLTFLLLGVFATTPASAGQARLVEVPYDVGAPGPYAQAEVPNPTPLNYWRPFHLGGASVDVRQGETEVEVFALDDRGWKVGGRVAFYDEAGQQLALEAFCHRTPVLSMPAHTAEVTVLVSSTIQPCDVDGGNRGPATTGKILLTLR